MKAGSHHAQTKVTSYLDLVDSVNSIISKHPEIEYVHSQALTQQDSSTKFQDLFSPLFKHLITNAERNSQKLLQQIRHDTVIKNLLLHFLFTVVPCHIILFQVTCQKHFLVYVHFNELLLLIMCYYRKASSDLMNCLST